MPMNANQSDPTGATPAPQHLVAVAALQGRDSARLAGIEPQTWLFAERARYVTEGRCDPYAEQILRLVNLLPAPS